MKPYDTALTIVAPTGLEENLVDRLLELAEMVSGFTITQVEGQGHAMPLHGTTEEVRGRARRAEIQIVMNGEDAARLIAQLKQALPISEIAYWMSPVTEFGRFK